MNGESMPRQSASLKYDRWPCFARTEIRWKKQLVSDVHAVGRLLVNDLRNDVRVHRKFLREFLDGASAAARGRQHRDKLGLLGRGIQDAEILPGSHGDW